MELLVQTAPRMPYQAYSRGVVRMATSVASGAGRGCKAQATGAHPELLSGCYQHNLWYASNSEVKS